MMYDVIVSSKSTLVISEKKKKNVLFVGVLKDTDKQDPHEFEVPVGPGPQRTRP
jgi:hypothetical protein